MLDLNIAVVAPLFTGDRPHSAPFSGKFLASSPCRVRAGRCRRVGQQANGLRFGEGFGLNDSVSKEFRTIAGPRRDLPPLQRRSTAQVRCRMRSPGRPRNDSLAASAVS